MTTDHKPDMIAQAGDLLTAYSKRESKLPRFPSDERDANLLLLASVLLTVAGELRDVRNIILESATAIAESLGPGWRSVSASGARTATANGSARAATPRQQHRTGRL